MYTWESRSNPALLRYIISLQVAGKVKKYSSDFALDYLTENVLFLNDNFPNVIWVKTDNRSLDEIVDKIMEKLDL